jgi:hypothetical protein
MKISNFDKAYELRRKHLALQALLHHITMGEFTIIQRRKGSDGEPLNMHQLSDVIEEDEHTIQSDARDYAITRVYDKITKIKADLASLGADFEDGEKPDAARMMVG